MHAVISVVSNRNKTSVAGTITAFDSMRGMLTLSGLGELGPHLLDALEDHVAVAVEGLHPPQQLLVVPAVDQDLQ